MTNHTELMTTDDSPSILNPPIGEKKGDKTYWGNIDGVSSQIAISNVANHHPHLTAIVVDDNIQGQKIKRTLMFFNPQAQIHLFPDWETLPYDKLSPHQDLIAKRLSVLSKLSHCSQMILLLPISTLIHRLPPKDFVNHHSFDIKVGDTLDIDKFRNRLQQNGYYGVNQVTSPGEFSTRGGIFDLFPIGTTDGYRIELFDDEVEGIRKLDISNQRSTTKVDKIFLMPAKEFQLNPDTISLFQQKWQQSFPKLNPRHCPLYQDVIKGMMPAGIEYYLPLFFTDTATLFDYLPDTTLLICQEQQRQKIAHIWERIHQRYDELSSDISHPILAPKELFIAENELFAQMNRLLQIIINKQAVKPGRTRFNFYHCEMPSLAVNHRLDDPLIKLKTFIEACEKDNRSILICADSLGRQEAIIKLLKQLPYPMITVNSWQDCLKALQKEQASCLLITIVTIDHGLISNNPSFAMIAESQLFGYRPMQRRSTKTTAIHQEMAIANLVELKEGDLVVHIDHGIGRYCGLKTIEVDDKCDEFLMLTYAKDNKLYVPITSLNLISRYVTTDVERVVLHELGTNKWQRLKQKVIKRTQAIAKELLAIHARRASQQGYVFKKPNDNYQQFSDDFPFTTTDDQQQAIEDIINDMCSDKVMDRLICGDVGFGKTEVALRGAFLCVENNKQVALISPTTLLAHQHYQTFQDRFANWPINIAILSRFISPKNQKKIIEQLNDGKVDIIIGTHRLLQKDIQFARLGLLVIDEEHRFGVRHKEKLKNRHSLVDTLALTATPIPRTLNMSLSGIRDLSLISQPPAHRLAIKTFVVQRQKHIIREAMVREIMRGGQIYFLHNRVQTINRVADELQALVPEARFAIAHGQLAEKELEQIMIDFYHQRFNVLVCTTIIESGIDIPTANTIIIDRADRFGLAELHQLRGRVGRSHHQAYSYLLLPPPEEIKNQAKKRIQAISSLKDLGMGFTLASHDLEIRGAGELLGSEQSGHMSEIGFNLYMDMLEQAIEQLKQDPKAMDKQKDIDPTTAININVNALIPENYIANANQRVVFYKRLANCVDIDAILALKTELIDRFGLLPIETENLFTITAIKHRGQKLGIEKITIADKQQGHLTFQEKTPINPIALIHWLQHKPGYAMINPTTIKFSISNHEGNHNNEANPQLNQVNQLLMELNGLLAKTSQY